MQFIPQEMVDSSFTVMKKSKGTGKHTPQNLKMLTDQAFAECDTPGVRDFLARVVKLQSVFRMLLARKQYFVLLGLEKVRHEAANEIISTEKEYVSNVKKMSQAFLETLRHAMGGSPGSPKEDSLLTSISARFDGILTSSKLLVCQLTIRLTCPPLYPVLKFGDLFAEVVPEVQKSFVQFIHAMQDVGRFMYQDSQKWVTNPQCVSLVSIPVHHIRRYIVIVEDIMKVTWVHHPDYDALAEAAELLTAAEQNMCAVVAAIAPGLELSADPGSPIAFGSPSASMPMTPTSMVRDCHRQKEKRSSSAMESSVGEDLCVIDICSDEDEEEQQNMVEVPLSSAQAQAHAAPPHKQNPRKEKKQKSKVSLKSILIVSSVSLVVLLLCGLGGMLALLLL